MLIRVKAGSRRLETGIENVLLPSAFFLLPGLMVKKETSLMLV
jgi:hypothetical protein